MAQLRCRRVATLEWDDWFNNRRLLEPIGNIPRPKPSDATAPCWNSKPWPRNLNQPASGSTGAVQEACHQCHFFQQHTVQFAVSGQQVKDNTVSQSEMI